MSKRETPGTRVTALTTTSSSSTQPAHIFPPKTPADSEPLTLAQVLQPDHPCLKDDVPAKWTVPYINTWAKQFDEAIQDSATEIMKLLQASSTTEAQLQEAAVRYGIPLLKVTKINLRSLQQLVATGAAMAC